MSHDLSELAALAAMTRASSLVSVGRRGGERAYGWLSVLPPLDACVRCLDTITSRLADHAGEKDSASRFRMDTLCSLGAKV